MNKNSRFKIMRIAAAAAAAGLAGGVPARSAEIAAATPVEAQTHLQGGPGAAVVAKQVILKNLPNVTAADAQAFRSIRPRTALLNLSAVKTQAARPSDSPAPVTLYGEPQSPPNINPLTPGASLSFDGDTEFEACSNLTPADQAIAVGDGPSPILQAVNACVSVWNPSGARLLGPKSLVSFFNLPAGTFVSDPRALYDFYNHRFIVTLLDSDFASSNNYNIAVSAGDDPTGGWYTYRIPVQSASNALPDFPRVGQDRSSIYPISSGTAFPGAIYVAANLFSNAKGGGYLKEEWLILPKAAMYNGQAFSFWQFNGMTSGGVPTDTTQPVNVWSPYDNPRAEFLITSEDFYCSTGCNGLTLWAISNPFGFVSGGPGPELTGAIISTVNNYSQPPNASQPGSANSVDSGDLRISGEATYQSGSIYAAHSSANGAGGVMSILYRVQPTLNINDSRCTGSYLNLCPMITGASILDETILNYGGMAGAYYAVPQPDLEGNVTTVFTYSGNGTYPGLAYISQRATQGYGSFVDNGYFLIAGQASYTQARWGDYNAVAPAGVAYLVGNGQKPVTPGAAFSGMYAGLSNNWKTRIGFNKFTSPAQP